MFQNQVMTSSGGALRFGYFLVPNADVPLLQIAQRVEQLGLDYIAVQDHPYQRRFVETWTLLSMIAAATSRIGLFTDVANLPLRPPAVLAKAAASLDQLSGGRVELGLGAGGFWDAIAAFGGPRRTPAESVQALAEAVEVIRRVWSGERNVRFDGAHYRIWGANVGPVPAHRMGIWLAADGPRALRLTGRVADGWITSFRGSVSDYAAKAARLDEAASAAGRDPTSLRHVLNVGGQVTDGASLGLLRGPVDQWIDELAMFAREHRVDTFVLWAEGERQLEVFATEIVPALRSTAGLAARDRADDQERLLS